MTIKECYDKMGADYDSIFNRLGNEELIGYLALKFTKDDNMEKLIDALLRRDYEAAFMAVHTLKGVVLNLGFTQLEPSVAAFTEELRGGKEPKNLALLEVAQDAYARTMLVLEEYRADQQAF